MLNLIRDTPGYATGLRLTNAELSQVKQLVFDHLAQQVFEAAPEHSEMFLRTPLEQYHGISHLLPHRELLARTRRILPRSAVEQIRATSLFRHIESELGPVEISDEENMGRESISIRLVRPGMDSDIGSLHADHWFWPLYGFALPPGRQRVKVWVAVCCEAGKAGLLLSPDSHAREWKYDTVSRGGMLKPLLDASEKPVLELFASEPGAGVAFNYHLLHGGAVTRSETTRVSMEFTLLVPDRVYFSRSAAKASGRPRSSLRGVSQ
jgi:hypothetical protein